MEPAVAQDCWTQCTLVVVMSPVFSPNTCQCHDRTNPDGYKMEKPAGPVTCQWTEKELHPLRTCARCSFSFPCRSRFSGSAEASQAPLSYPPTAHSMHHAQLSTDISISVIAELSDKEKNNKKKAMNKKQAPSNNNKKQNQQINFLYFQLFSPCSETMLPYYFVSSLQASTDHMLLFSHLLFTF